MAPVFRAFGDLNRMKIIKVMDFDCGGGVSTRGRAKLLSRGGEVTGVDISSVMVGRAEKRISRHPNASVVKGELSALDIRDSTFDVATIAYVIHDIAREKREGVATALARVLKPRGMIWVLEPTKPSHGIPVEELRALMTGASLEEISAEVKKSSYRGTFMKRP